MRDVRPYLNKNQVTISHKNATILNGKHDPNGPYTVPLPPSIPTLTGPPSGTTVPGPTLPPRHQPIKSQMHFTVYDSTTNHIIKFLHLALLSPTKSTFLIAIQNNHFVGWPGITKNNVILGHMDQQRKGTRSTQTDDTKPAITNTNGKIKSQQAFLSIHDLPTGRIYTDQTGSFPVVSAQGIKSVMVLYDNDSNAILIEGITSRNQGKLLRAYQILLKQLRRGVVPPAIQRMDNEVSQTFKDFLNSQNITLERTYPRTCTPT